MKHVLDNPAWNGLIGCNSALAEGDNRVKFFDPEVSPFVGLCENTPENFHHLYEIVPHQSPLLFVNSRETLIPEPWKILACVKGLQMVNEYPIPPYNPAEELVNLTDEHAPEMLALTKLTNPGPFALRTIAFGHYKGIFHQKQLAAMAGHRLKPAGYTEISAVCTHPDHTGKGYARKLLQYHINQIRSEQNIPFLHVRYDNERAIKVYESLGFATRTEVYFYVLQKSGQ